MTTLTEKFTALEGQLADIETAANLDRDLTNTKLQAMLDMLDIINTNAAANTKAILGALGQTGACFPCPTPAITVPPVGTTPGALNSDRCKRAQAMIATLRTILTDMDTMQSFNVVGTYNVISDAISTVIGGIAAGDTVPLPSFPETVNIVGDYISYAGERLFSGVGLIEQFSPLEAALTQAIFFTGTPGAAQAAYNGVIDTSSASNGAKLLFKAIAYNALWSYYFDPSTTPDLSAYDGSICGSNLIGITSCVDLASTVVTFDGHSYQVVIANPPLDAFSWHIAGNFNGFTFHLLSGTPGKTYNVYRLDSGGSVVHLAASLTTTSPDGFIGENCEGMEVVCADRDGDATAFTVRICPPS